MHCYNLDNDCVKLSRKGSPTEDLRVVFVENLYMRSSLYFNDKEPLELCFDGCEEYWRDSIDTAQLYQCDNKVCNNS